MRGADGMLARRITRALRSHGCEVVLRGAVSRDERRVWACILPFMHRNRQYLEERLTVLGRGEPNSFLYLGETAGGDGAAQPGDFVEDDGERYVFSSSTVLRYRGEAAYVWGILKKAEGEGAVWAT